MEQLTLATISKNLTYDVIDRVFKIKTNSEDNVESVEVTAAAAGEGMISSVYKIKVTGKNLTETFIAKGLVQNALLRNTLPGDKCFEREALFFSKILPVLVDIQKELGAKESIQNYLPVFYECHIDGKNDYIIMEDLTVRGYKSLPSHITKYERDIILKLLAHFHSVSLALRVRKLDSFLEITNGLNDVYYNEGNRDWYASYFQKALSIDKNVIAEIDGTNGAYYKKFEEFLKGDLYGELLRMTSERGDHSIINHGDSWYPNFLCCEDHAVAIDFQIIRCASLATDLSYFLILSSNLGPSKEDFFEAVNIYYKSLEFYLNDMGIDANEVFSLDTLKEELKKYGKFGLLGALTSIPLMATERVDISSFKAKPGCDKIPLEELWRLYPISTEKDKLRLVNAVRVAIDVGFI